MKDLEKIKSENLGCQVADANPGNFAIEQEVAAMVGATVPAPTEPSADDARELGAQLLVFLRRALLPIRSALRTAVAAIYAHLDSRCTDYTPAAYAPYKPLPSYDPMGTPPTPRTVANLLTALTAFSARKISNGGAPSDGIPDGISLAHLLMGTYASVTEIKDDNTGWALNRSLLDIFPNLKKLVLQIEEVRGNSVVDCQTNIFNTLEEIELPKLKRLINGTITKCGDNYGLNGLHSISLPALEYVSNSCICYTSRNNNNHQAMREVHFPKLEQINYGSMYPFFQAGTSTDHIRLYFDSLEQATGNGSFFWWNSGAVLYMYIGYKTNDRSRAIVINETSSHALSDLELKDGWRKPLNVSGCTSLTAENIVNHIFNRLGDNSDGAPITINIGSTNLAKLTDEQKAIAQNKNYTLA